MVRLFSHFDNFTKIDNFGCQQYATHGTSSWPRAQEPEHLITIKVSYRRSNRAHRCPALCAFMSAQAMEENDYRTSQSSTHAVSARREHRPLYPRSTSGGHGLGEREGQGLDRTHATTSHQCTMPCPATQSPRGASIPHLGDGALLPYPSAECSLPESERTS